MSSPAVLDRLLMSVMGIDPDALILKPGGAFGCSWVVEWSQSQQAFHTQTLLEHLQTNILRYYHEGKTGDYVALGVFPTREAADTFYALCIDRMKRWGLSSFTPEDLLRNLSP